MRKTALFLLASLAVPAALSAGVLEDFIAARRNRLDSEIAAHAELSKNPRAQVYLRIFRKTLDEIAKAGWFRAKGDAAFGPNEILLTVIEPTGSQASVYMVGTEYSCQLRLQSIGPRFLEDGSVARRDVLVSLMRGDCWGPTQFKDQRLEMDNFRVTLD